MSTTRTILEDLIDGAKKKAVTESGSNYNTAALTIKSEKSRNEAEKECYRARAASTKVHDRLIEVNPSDTIIDLYEAIAGSSEEEYDDLGGFTAAERLFMDGYYSSGTSKGMSQTRARAPKRRRHGK